MFPLCSNNTMLHGHIYVRDTFVEHEWMNNFIPPPNQQFEPDPRILVQSKISSYTSFTIAFACERLSILDKNTLQNVFYNTCIMPGCKHSTASNNIQLQTNLSIIESLNLVLSKNGSSIRYNSLNTHYS